MVDIPYEGIAGIPPAEVPEVELYHPRSWWTRYVFSQAAKVIAILVSFAVNFTITHFVVFRPKGNVQTPSA